MFDDYAAAQRLIEARKRDGLTDRPSAPRPDAEDRRPRTEVPPGACDCHFHIIGPQRVFPLDEKRPFDYLVFEDSPLEDWLALQDRLGFTRGLHVQSMMYGYDYGVVLNSQFRAGNRMRAVVALWPEVTDGELDVLERAGVIGARISSSVTPEIDEHFVARLCERGWQIHYLFRAKDMPAWREPVLRTPGRFVIEHMGYVPPEKGLDSDEYRLVRSAAETGRCWVKLSPRPSSAQTFPFDDLRPVVDALVEAVPEQLLFGTDWPHPQYFRPMPHDADLVDLLGEWVSHDRHLLSRILAENPAEAFSWPLSDAETAPAAAAPDVG